jgi:hypothetical protein
MGLSFSKQGACHPQLLKLINGLSHVMRSAMQSGWQNRKPYR